MRTKAEQTPAQPFLDLIEADPKRFMELVEEEFHDSEVVRSLDERYVAIRGRWVADLEWEDIRPLRDWLKRAGEGEAAAFGIEERDFNEKFWARPTPLYHATKPANRDGIEREGLRPEARTRGVSNRRVGDSVFTSTDPDELGAYGPVIVEVDAARMKSDGVMPRVSREPDVEAADMMNRLAHLLGCEEFQAEIEAGLSEQTVIVHGALSAKYLRVCRDQAVRPLPTPRVGRAIGFGA